MVLNKAYDCLPHYLMLAKLEDYGLANESLHLSYRKQKTKIGSEYSDWVNVICGISQVFILGP